MRLLAVKFGILFENQIPHHLIDHLALLRISTFSAHSKKEYEAKCFILHITGHRRKFLVQQASVGRLSSKHERLTLPIYLHFSTLSSEFSPHSSTASLQIPSAVKLTSTEIMFTKCGLEWKTHSFSSRLLVHFWCSSIQNHPSVVATTERGCRELGSLAIRAQYELGGRFLGVLGLPHHLAMGYAFALEHVYQLASHWKSS